MENSFNSETPKAQNRKKWTDNPKKPGAFSESGSSPPIMLSQNSPYQETNEGKLIKKLGDKQKMLEKYESMLQKVNVEFQNTLGKNKELTDQISFLEIQCQKAEERANGVQDMKNSEKYGLQRQLDELVLEKDEIQRENISLNKIINTK